MSITGTTIARNAADSGLGGGGVSAGKLTITDSTIGDNVATGSEFAGGTLSIVGSTIDGNGAGPDVGYGVNLGPDGGDTVVTDSSRCRDLCRLPGQRARAARSAAHPAVRPRGIRAPAVRGLTK